jgi:hypothetical protein
LDSRSISSSASVVIVPNVASCEQNEHYVRHSLSDITNHVVAAVHGSVKSKAEACVSIVRT